MANEKRLADVDALIADIEKRYCEPCKAEGKDYNEVACRACWVDDMRLEIDGASVVDAVEVVRCKDCKHWVHSDDVGYCDNPDGLDNYARPNDFCSYGERKDNGT